MIKKLIILSLLISALGCKKSKESKVEINQNNTSANRFDSKVFGFNYPEDWSVTEEEEIDDGVYYIAVEKEGFDASGLVTVLSFEELISLDETITVNMEELQSNSLINILNSSTIKDTNFNGVPARALDFNFSSVGIKHEGSIYAFASENNTVVVLKQEALEDQRENAEGFNLIERSFEIR